MRILKDYQVGNKGIQVIKEQVKPNEYFYEHHCDNCGNTMGFAITKGTTIYDALNSSQKEVKCDTCGCKPFYNTGEF